MGLEPFLLSSSAECFIAQRLVRLICPACKQPVKAKDRLMDLLDKRGTGFPGREAFARVKGARLPVYRLSRPDGYLRNNADG